MVKDILHGLNFLHSNCWIHGDIKPNNIGVRSWDKDRASIVLLDLDDATYAPDGYIPAKPGTGGTIGWLSPEREMTGFTATADVWAVGVIALWLLRGNHPWLPRVNPWRSDLGNERDQQKFHDKYNQGVAYARQLPHTCRFGWD